MATDNEVLARERRTNKVYSNFYPGTSNYFYTQRTSGHNPFQAHLPVSCGHPGQPRNGRTRYSRTTPGSIVLHTCNPGYKLEGAKLRLCQSNGRWTPQLPRCTCKCSCFLGNHVRMLPLLGLSSTPISTAYTSDGDLCTNAHLVLLTLYTP